MGCLFLSKMIARRKRFKLSVAFYFVCFTMAYILILRQNDSGKESTQTEELTEVDVASGKLRLDQGDPTLLRYILKNHLTPPAPRGGPVDITPYDLSVRVDEQQEVVELIAKLLQYKTEGTFIECGANDGEYYSNTLSLEVSLNWTGVLIEADPRPLSRLLRRKRNSWIAGVSLCTDQTPKRIRMLRNDKHEGISFIPGQLHFLEPEEDYYSFETQCFPLYSILRAINLTEVDYFSLDVEGAELAVLKAIPWDKVLIKTLSIEVHKQYQVPVKTFMTSIGYNFVKFLVNGYSHDQIYAHSSLDL